jgi:hypothetical protein
MGALTGAAADASAATFEVAMRAWTGAAADAPMADDGIGEAVAVRMREWASIEEEKEGLYKDEGGMYRNARLQCTAAACTATDKGIVNRAC